MILLLALTTFVRTFTFTCTYVFFFYLSNGSNTYLDQDSLMDPQNCLLHANRLETFRLWQMLKKFQQNLTHPRQNLSSCPVSRDYYHKIIAFLLTNSTLFISLKFLDFKGKMARGNLNKTG